MNTEIGGYVLIYRRLLDHTAFRTDAEAMAFAWLVLRASWRDVEVRYKDRAVTLKRGQLAMSVRDMATHLERSKDWANRFLARLIDRDMVCVDTATGVTIISINNYNSFQLDPKGQCDRTATAPRQDRDTTATQNNKGNEEKEEKKEKGKGGFELPDWVDPEAWNDWEEYRREIKHPLTDRARKGCVTVLRDAMAAGFSTRETIDLAIVSNWRGLFIPKGKPKQPLNADPMRPIKATPQEQAAYDKWMKGVL